MDTLSQLMNRIAYPFLRITMGLVLVWIGGLKFVDPAPVVGLIGASPFSALASNGFVYLLGAGEVLVGLLFWANIQVKYVGILNMGLFVGTIAILIDYYFSKHVGIGLGKSTTDIDFSEETDDGFAVEYKQDGLLAYVSLVF